jgi:hypothetical protein
MDAAFVALLCRAFTLALKKCVVDVDKINGKEVRSII